MSEGAPVIWLNDGLAPADAVHITATDRGFTLGDGVFETMRARGGRILNLRRHLARLRAGAELIGIALPFTDYAAETAILRTLSANGLAEAVVRLTVSRGVPRTRGLLPDPNPQLTLVIDAQPFVGASYALYARGMRAITSTVRRDERSPLARAKTLSYLENVLARREAGLHGADEALMLNTEGNLVCASAANLFLVIDGALTTPDLDSGPLPGTTRELVIRELAPDSGLEVVEHPITPSDLPAVTEAFVTNALLGIMPLTVIDGQPVGTGRPGPFTARLQAALTASNATAT